MVGERKPAPGRRIPFGMYPQNPNAPVVVPLKPSGHRSAFKFCLLRSDALCWDRLAAIGVETARQVIDWHGRRTVPVMSDSHFD
jgi:hypothetical protein